MSGVNKVILVGRLGLDPEVKDINGLSICNFSVATSKEWRDDSGEKKEKTEWHKIVAFKDLAGVCGKYLSKGSQVYVEGEIQTRSWETDSGEKKYMTEIVARSVQFLSTPKSADTEEDKVDPKEESSHKLYNHAPGADNSGVEEELPF